MTLVPGADENSTPKLAGVILSTSFCHPDRSYSSGYALALRGRPGRRNP